MICGLRTALADATEEGADPDGGAGGGALKLVEAPKDMLTVLTTPAIEAASSFERLRAWNPIRDYTTYTLQLSATIHQIINLDKIETRISENQKQNETNGQRADIKQKNLVKKAQNTPLIKVGITIIWVISV